MTGPKSAGSLQTRDVIVDCPSPPAEHPHDRAIATLAHSLAANSPTMATTNIKDEATRQRIVKHMNTEHRDSVRAVSRSLVECPTVPDYDRRSADTSKLMLHDPCSRAAARK